MTLTVVSAPLGVAPTGAPFTWNVYEPETTDDATLMGRLLAAPAVVGVIGSTLNVPHVIPVGSPEQERVTVVAVPAVSLAVIVTEPELPA